MDSSATAPVAPDLGTRHQFHGVQPVLPVRKPSVLSARPLHESGRTPVPGETARFSVLGGIPLNEAARLAASGVEPT